MCGICGIFNLNNQPIDTTQLSKMATIIRHRGPDDEGFILANTNSKDTEIRVGNDTIESFKQRYDGITKASNANLGMGFRRLSIIDLTEAGHQPMTDLTGNNWIVFNGEIYNYIEIRNELKSLNYNFKSETDTEVILNAYNEWGINCVKRFNGMFSFAIYDSIKRKLYCARDRVGVKPFYYSFDGNTFVWASEIKQFIKSGIINPEINHSNLYNFLLMSRLNVDKNTFFKNIIELQPAHILEIGEDGIQISKYWDINPLNYSNSRTDADYAAEFRDLFTDAVKLRLRSDVPLGIALSGGLDSSSIACIASSLVPSSIKTFSVYYEDDKKFDEREYITEVLKMGKFDPVYFTSNKNISLDELKKFFYYQDEPCMGASPFSAYKNNENIRKSGIIVALNGQGGDELLAGYHTYFKYYYIDLIRKLQIGKFANEFAAYQKEFKTDLKNTLSLMSKIGLRLFLPDKFLKRFEHLELSNTGFYSSNLKKYQSDIDLPRVFKGDLDNNLYTTLMNTSIPHLLHWEDRNSMAHSIESRVPFLDYRLVELAFSMPISQKIRGAETKYILRNSMKGILPEKVRTRMDKVGFATPTDLWTKSLLKDEILDVFSSKSFEERGLFNTKQIIEAFTNNPNTFKENEIWRVFSVEMWLREFFD